MRSASRLLPIVVAALALPVTALPAFGEEAPRAGIISLSGEGVVDATPDMASVTSGVVTQGRTAGEALDTNTAAMSELIAVLEDAGIEARDIQTSGFSVQPQYVYSDKRDEHGYTLPPRIVGYQVSNSVTVRVRELETLGAMLDRAVTVGANTIDGVSFGVAETGELMAEARKLAMADAIAKAKLYAEAAGIGLGRILAISEGGGARPRPEPEMMMRSMVMAAPSAPVPVQAGELSFRIHVTVQWELEQD